MRSAFREIFRCFELENSTNEVDLGKVLKVTEGFITCFQNKDCLHGLSCDVINLDMDLIKKTITDNIENINTKLQDNVLKNQETLKLLIKLKNINSIINLSEN